MWRLLSLVGIIRLSSSYIKTLRGSLGPHLVAPISSHLRHSNNQFVFQHWCDQFSIIHSAQIRKILQNTTMPTLGPRIEWYFSLLAGAWWETLSGWVVVGICWQGRDCTHWTPDISDRNILLRGSCQTGDCRDDIKTKSIIFFILHESANLVVCAAALVKKICQLSRKLKVLESFLFLFQSLPV